MNDAQILVDADNIDDMPVDVVVDKAIEEPDVDTTEYMKLFDKVGKSVEELSLGAKMVHNAAHDQQRVERLCKYVDSVQTHLEEVYTLLVSMHNVFSK
jgi:hypothetical protein